MSQPDPVNILSDDDDDDDGNGGTTGNYDRKDTSVLQSLNEPVCIDLCTPYSNLSKKTKKPRLSDPANTNLSLGSTDFPVFVIDDDVSPRKPSPGPTSVSRVAAETPTLPPISSHFSTLESVSVVRCSYGSFGVNSTPSVVDETPVSELSKLQVPIIRCNRAVSSFQPLISDHLSPGVNSTPSVVDETPVSELSELEVPIIRCNCAVSSFQQLISDHLSPDRLINLGSDSESERGLESQEPEKARISNSHVAKALGFSSKFVESAVSFGEINRMNMPGLSSSLLNSSEDHLSQVHGFSDVESDRSLNIDKVSELECEPKDEVISKRSEDGSVAVGRMSKEGRLQMKEEKKLQREQEKLKKAIKKAEALELKKQEKLKKAAEKAEAAELRKLQKEKQKWEKGKFAQKSIVAHIDNKVVEMGSVGGHLLTRFGEKGLSFRVASNPIERSIVWSMSIPEELSQISSERNVIPYVLLIYGAEEFCNVIMSGALFNQVSQVCHQYPSYTICFLVNRLMAYINKREQGQYKNPDKYEGWKRPPIEEVLAKLTTHYIGVHSRLCADEAELAEHVVSLTYSLASCQYRKKLTPLSVNANGSLVPKDCADRDLIKKDMWLKALIAIPKVQPRFAIAISKKYPTMRSLLSVYMDPSKSVHEKECLLMDLSTEGLLGDDRRLGEICSKRVYRVLMAQCGTMLTDDVEDGADYFSQQTT